MSEIIKQEGTLSGTIQSQGTLKGTTRIPDIILKEASVTSNDGTIISKNVDYAEVGEWADGNIYDEDRIGYFVAIDLETEGTTIVKANSKSDVRGVTVVAPAFSGNYTDDKLNEDKTLKKQYDFVANMGIVSVRQNGECILNGRCMPNDDGIAVPSSNNMGYQIIKVIDDTHILIAFEPSADMIQRIRSDTERLESEKQSKTIIDDGEYYISDTVEGALQEIGEAIDKFTYVSPTVTLNVTGANSIEELGKVLSSVTISATANKECKSLKLYSGNTLLQSAEKATSLSSTVEDVSTTTTFKVVATDKYNKNIQKTSTISFYNGVYYGVASYGVSISELSKRLQGNNNCEFSGNAGVDQYFFFASPTRYGTPSFKDKDTGFGADFTLIDGNISFTNASGYEETYQFYRSTHPALGRTTITVY